MQLTARQQMILDYLHEHLVEHHSMPTLQEIGNHFRIAATSVVDHLKFMEKKGVIELNGKARGIKLKGVRIYLEVE